MKWLLVFLALAVFRNIAHQAGFIHTFPNGGDTSKKFIIETTGSGVAIFDFDNDDLQDIVVVSGDGAPSRLYRNLNSGTKVPRGLKPALQFEDITERVGLARQGWGQGACAADVNNDGWTDLLITYWGKNALYRNIDGRRLESVALPESETRYNTGCVFFDYDRDGDLDLFISNYLEFDFGTTPLPGANPYCFYRGIAVNCGPRGLPFSRNRLFRNDGNFRFTDVSIPSGIAGPKQNYSLGAIATDVDNDGWPDLYVACDQTPSILYINKRDGTFEDEAMLRGVALDENGKALSGMGVAAADYDNDGAIDLFRTNFSDERVTLYRNRGDGNFDETTIAAGLGANTRYVGWGTAFLDFDNDGWKDLLYVNGHVFPEVDRLNIEIKSRQRAILYRNNAGRFSETPAPTETHCSRGLAIGDFDNDGYPEAVINNQNEPPSLWKLASGSKNNWLMLRLSGQAIGARVKLTACGKTHVDEVRAGGSYLSQHDPRIHFGLGSCASVDKAEVRWPSGTTTVHSGLRPNRIEAITPRQ